MFGVKRIFLVLSFLLSTILILSCSMFVEGREGGQVPKLMIVQRVGNRASLPPPPPPTAKTGNGP
ncbi:hypothetical protein AAG906_013902 [Vitis piasezkii]